MRGAQYQLPWCVVCAHSSCCCLFRSFSVRRSCFSVARPLVHHLDQRKQAGVGHGRAPKVRPRRGAAGFRVTPERAVPTRVVDCCRISHHAPSVTRRIMRHMAWREAMHMRAREADVAQGVERGCIVVDVDVTARPVSRVVRRVVWLQRHCAGCVRRAVQSAPTTELRLRHCPFASRYFVGWCGTVTFTLYESSRTYAFCDVTTRRNTHTDRRVATDRTHDADRAARRAQGGGGG
jgi:hypothetical protein